MARPKSEDKRTALVKSAVRVFAEQGLGAPTSRIAKGAGVSEGTLFNYFETKDDLLNQVYLDVKAQLRDAMIPGYPKDQDLKRRLHHAWHTYVNWGVAHPLERKAMALLMMCDRLTEASRRSGSEAFGDIQRHMQEGTTRGVLRDQPTAFIAAIMRSLAETTMDFMTNEPEHAERYCDAGFEAYWNAIAKD
ncbi:TetR/AcrR family transcriptional regulator [Pseudomonas sp. GD03842]|uniref:TetR/AcrR family transcriptional regulator n=1 Tax=Pseudomonas sp. GD03842 TaxID=2975385 RepID=UPI00244BFCD6|nr:TetR/AcrR family transcriptional regulator [Pseudomonas sp. GD03842]MDH0745329.1 TetR/AcrR family transcriptional regulator [Pseudomonas sp. GD03842]